MTPNNLSITNARCKRCGAEFDCRADNIAQCHCSLIKLSDYQLRYIADRWQGCLCAECLREVSKQEATPSWNPGH